MYGMKNIVIITGASSGFGKEFAKKIGLSRVNYTRYETGKVRPDYETVIKIADFYDVSLDELFDRKN